MAEHWMKIPEDRKQFHIMSYAVLAKHGIVPNERAYLVKPWDNAAYTAVMDRIKESVDFSQTPTPAHGVQAVRQWVDEHRAQPEHASNIATVTVKVTRHYQDVSLEYGLTADYKIQHLGMVTSAFQELRDIVEAQHELAAENRPALMPSHNNGGGGQAVQYADVQITHVRREFIDGADRIRLIGGEFNKYGVPVYPEFFGVLGIDVDKLPFGDTPYTNKVRVILDAAGKPKRAIEVV